MPYLLDWTSHSLIRKRFLHSKGSLIRYLLPIIFYKTVKAHPHWIHCCSLTVFYIQVTHFGCKSFALLFDDIDHNMCPADKEVFSSFAHAQVSLTNEIFQYLGEPETFLFCPTGTHIHCRYFSYFQNISLILHYCFVFPVLCPEYCGTFCYPNVSQSPYLHTVGEKLLPGIDILWTGEFEAWSQSTRSEDNVSLEMRSDYVYLLHNRSQCEHVCNAKIYFKNDFKPLC